MRFFAAVLLAALGMVELVLRLAVMLVLVCTVIGAICAIEGEWDVTRPLLLEAAARVFADA